MTIKEIVNQTYTNGQSYGEAKYSKDAFNIGYQDAIDANVNAHTEKTIILPFKDNKLITITEDATFQEKYEVALQNQEKIFCEGVNDNFINNYDSGFNGITPNITATLTDVVTKTRYDPDSSAKRVYVQVDSTGWDEYNYNYPQNVTVTITLESYEHSTLSGNLCLGTKNGRIGRNIEPPSNYIRIESLGSKTYTLNVTTNDYPSHNLNDVYDVLDLTNSAHKLLKYILDVCEDHGLTYQKSIVIPEDGYNGERFYIGNINEVNTYDLSYDFSFNASIPEGNYLDHNLMTTTSGKLDKFALSSFSSTYTKTKTNRTSLESHWESAKLAMAEISTDLWKFIGSVATAPNGTGEVGEIWDMSNEFKVVYKCNE